MTASLNQKSKTTSPAGQEARTQPSMNRPIALVTMSLKPEQRSLMNNVFVPWPFLYSDALIFPSNTFLPAMTDVGLVETNPVVCDNFEH